MREVQSSPGQGVVKCKEEAPAQPICGQVPQSLQPERRSLTMTRIYECGTCGVISEEPAQLCKPLRRENMGVYCDDSGQSEKMCPEMKDHLAVVCGSCGRPAQQAEMVCEPLQTG